MFSVKHNLSNSQLESLILINGFKWFLSGILNFIFYNSVLVILLTECMTFLVTGFIKLATGFIPKYESNLFFFYKTGIWWLCFGRIWIHIISPICDLSNDQDCDFRWTLFLLLVINKRCSWESNLHSVKKKPQKLTYPNRLVFLYFQHNNNLRFPNITQFMPTAGLHLSLLLSPAV